MRAAFINQCDHGAPHSFRTAYGGIAGHFVHGGGCELDRGVGVHGPVRNEHGPGLGIDEGASKSGQCGRVNRVTASRIAGRQNDPIDHRTGMFCEEPEDRSPGADLDVVAVSPETQEVRKPSSSAEAALGGVRMRPGSEAPVNSPASAP